MKALLAKYQYSVLTITLTGDYKVIYQRFLEREISSDRHRGHVVNDCYPEKKEHTTKEIKVTSISYEDYVNGRKQRGFDTFYVDGRGVAARSVMENLEFVADIKSYTVIEKIKEGYSGDEKYKLEKDGEYFLLRVGDKNRLSEKKKEYNRLKAYTDKDINTHKPIVFGTTPDKFYSIVSWVNGTPIMDVIKEDVSKNYYQLGRKVGNELLRLHSSCPITSKINWQDIIDKKTSVFLKNYHSMNIDFACSKNAEQYILKNICFMSNRPQVVLHGDFHWNNCVVDEMGNVGIIDFSGGNIGDPWYEFGGLLWALEYSDSFANGQIDGYFNTPPNEFWEVFKFYVALYAFEHLMYNNGTLEDTKNRIFNASRMLKVFGEDFELELPLFRYFR